MAADRCRMTLLADAPNVPKYLPKAGEFMFLLTSDNTGGVIKKFRRDTLALISRTSMDATATSRSRSASSAIGHGFMYARTSDNNYPHIIKVNLATGAGTDLGVSFGGLLLQDAKLVDENADTFLLVGARASLNTVYIEQWDKATGTLLGSTIINPSTIANYGGCNTHATAANNVLYFGGSATDPLGGIAEDLASEDTSWQDDLYGSGQFSNTNQTSFNTNYTTGRTTIYGNIFSSIRIATHDYSLGTGLISEASAMQTLVTDTEYAASGVMNDTFLYAADNDGTLLYLHSDWGSDYAGSEQTEIFSIDMATFALDNYTALNSFATYGTARGGNFAIEW